MELTYTPSINNFDDFITALDDDCDPEVFDDFITALDEWTDWMIENVNAVNKSDLSEDEKRKLYCKILNKIVDCGYDIRDWED